MLHLLVHVILDGSTVRVALNQYLRERRGNHLNVVCKRSARNSALYLLSVRNVIDSTICVRTRHVFVPYGEREREREQYYLHLAACGSDLTTDLCPL